MNKSKQINFSDDENEFIKELAAKWETTATGAVRRCIRLVTAIEARMEEGEKYAIQNTQGGFRTLDIIF